MLTLGVCHYVQSLECIWYNGKLYLNYFTLGAPYMTGLVYVKLPQHLSETIDRHTPHPEQ